MSPRRIIILGSAATGKTSFSRQLAKRLAAPHVCLDEIWRPGWGPEEVPRFRELIRSTHAGEAWVSDGNFALATFDLRLPRAELVIWLERPKRVSAFNAFRRLAVSDQTHKWRGLPDVLRFIWRFDRINRPRVMAALAEHGPHVPVRRLKNRMEEAAVLAELDD